MFVNELFNIFNHGNGSRKIRHFKLFKKCEILTYGVIGRKVQNTTSSTISIQYL